MLHYSVKFRKHFSNNLKTRQIIMILYILKIYAPIQFIINQLIVAVDNNFLKSYNKIKHKKMYLSQKTTNNLNSLQFNNAQKRSFEELLQSDFEYDDDKSIKLIDIMSQRQFQNLYNDSIKKQINININKQQTHNPSQQQQKLKIFNRQQYKDRDDFGGYNSTQNKFWRTNTYAETLKLLSQQNQNTNSQTNLDYYEQLRIWQRSQDTNTNKKMNKPNNFNITLINKSIQNQKQSPFITVKLKNNKKRSNQHQLQVQLQRQIDQRCQTQKHFQDTSYIQQLKKLSFEDVQIREKDYMRSHMRVIENKYKKKIRELVDTYDNKDDQKNNKKKDNIEQNQSNATQKNLSQVLSHDNQNNSKKLQNFNQYEQLQSKLLQKLKNSPVNKSQEKQSAQINKNEQNQIDSISFQHLINRPPTLNYQKKINFIKQDKKDNTQKQNIKRVKNSFQNQFQNEENIEEKVKSQLKQLYASGYFPLQNQERSYNQLKKQEKQSLQPSRVKKSSQPKVKLNIQKLLKLSAKEFLLFYSQNYRKIVNLCNVEELGRLNFYRQKCLDKQSSIQKLQKLIRQKGESFIRKLSHQQRQKLFQVLYGNQQKLFQKQN